MTTSIYYAAPLFSNMEKQYNTYLVKKLRNRFTEENFYVPQEQGDINDKSLYADSKDIAKYDSTALLNSKLMVAVLDGPIIDPGVAAEIGIAYQAGIPVIALFTDSRQQGADHPDKLNALTQVAESQFPYANLFVVGLVKLNGAVLATEEEWLDVIETYL